ncbi:MAG: Zn-ribbon domain-containing OB-fold protein [Candidatus Nezhaarchaeota archaeon]|nr:Zn-ribbon domain-containing OB-fold protein [Candidatus Nezhaarchaeota archaeon]MCX8141397.1 Zn-ribbon domain-containing OB-fold protein [Candidatus Nezhaarchaeota archaeon]MDW8049663.1 Zn-ribbon domain-containing OB-fold protein [Nitrososphaerota archaeon]
MAQLQPPPTIESFYKFVAESKLMGVKCRKCGNVMVPPRPICDRCLSKELEWVQLKGEGDLISFTVIHIPPTQFASMAPYAVAIVKLDEGPKLPGIVKGITQPSQLRVGMRMKVSFEGAAVQQQTWPQWPRYFFEPL